MKNELPTSISRRVFWRYVNRKIKRVIHHYHVFSVINILFDELRKDLEQGKDIRIFNLGKLTLKDAKPRRYYDFTKGQMAFSEGYRILRFTLDPKIRKKLRDNLDTAFKDD